MIEELGVRSWDLENFILIGWTILPLTLNPSGKRPLNGCPSLVAAALKAA